MACEICTTGIPKAGEECYEAWAEEAKAQEAEMAAERAYLELPSMNEPIDEYEAAMKGLY